MRFLHTSDWHLGRMLYAQSRLREFEAFLDWLLHTIEEQQVELLIVAGDVFDTATPASRVLNMYYDFLYRVSLGCCTNVVVVGGNHDSPSVLNAPAQVLKVLNVHVVGEMTGDPEEELIILRDRQGHAEAIVCAVPFLRDRDVRSVQVGDEVSSRQEQLIRGIVGHYRLVAEKAEELRRAAGRAIPVIATGHLFTQSERSEEFEGEGVRDLYVGSLAYVDASLFPPTFDYVALGHIHRSQRVGGRDTLRYSGSPLPMGFREALYAKKVIIADTQDNRVLPRELEVPVFQSLLRLEGDFAGISERILQLKAGGSTAWLEIELTSDELKPQLTEEIQELLAGSGLQALKIKNRNFAAHALQTGSEIRSLDDLTEEEVFENCMNDHKVAEEEREELRRAFREILQQLVL
ncbi:MAG: exonuclease SbcCD subunit D C-terminal domain-containing protein [Bacteroidales bacterium]|nr:exonuclease SbcCD subunit D C-terminal domain-containing protein [Bacteroidales bacterium]